MRRTHTLLPLCVDLDGTLIRSDTFVESIVSYTKKFPLRICALVFQVFRSLARAKRITARFFNIQAEYLPFHEDILRMVRQAKNDGRKVFLVTGSDRHVARAVADHLGLFDAVWASDGVRNLTGERKARFLRKKLGNRFCYAGNAWADLPVWKEACELIVVSNNARLIRHVRSLGKSTTVFPQSDQSFIRILLGAMRIKKWPKNLLVFLPFIFGGQSLLSNGFTRVALAFLLFCFCASSVYLLNDVCDVATDRRSASKRLRPVARGVLSIPFAVMLAASLFLGSFFSAVLFSASIAVLLLCYVSLSLLYSVWLKRWAYVDVGVLVLLHSMRIQAGSMVSGVTIPFWFWVAVVFGFVSLALWKRYSEIAQSRNARKAVDGRGYVGAHRPTMHLLGLISSTCSIFAFLVFLSEMLISRFSHWQMAAFGLLPVAALYWRIWGPQLHVTRNDADPLTFLLKDTYSLLACLSLLLFCVIIW